MDGLGFAASVVKSLSWPATVLIAIAVFRAPLATLLANLKQASVGNVVLAFREQLGDIKSMIADSSAKERAATTEVSSALAAGSAPADVIEGAWNKLERALQDLSERRGLRDGRGQFRNAELIARTVEIPQETIDEVRKLRELRKSVLRQPEAFRAADAALFATVASEVMAKIPAA